MEVQLFPPGTVPIYSQPSWYAERESAPHLEQDGHRDRLQMAARFINEIAEPVTTIIDYGAGDGGLLSLLAPGRSVHGYDLQQSNVEAAKNRCVDVRYGDAVKLLESDPYSLRADVAVCTEMLEHLVDPHGFLKKVHATETSWLLASSPYTETEESHYEYHLWAWDILGYRYMLENAGWEVVQTGVSWICQVVLAKRVAL